MNEIQPTEMNEKIKDFEFNAIPKKAEKMYAGKAYTLEGMADVWFEDGKPIKVYPDVAEFKGFPKKWRQRHLIGFASISLLFRSIKEKQPKRAVPMLMQEVTEYVEKDVVKDLERMGLIGTHLVQLMDSGKRLGGRSVVWLTPEGYAMELEMNKRASESSPTDEPATEEIGE